MQIVSRSPLDTERAGRELAATLKAGDVVALFGGLGMGKTQFVRGLAQGLRAAGAVSSPTFALVHEYPGSPTLYHFDMYRVESYDDLYSTGFFDYLDLGGVCAIEWSENIENILPENAVRVTIAPGDDENGRVIMIEGGAAGEDSGH